MTRLRRGWRAHNINNSSCLSYREKDDRTELREAVFLKLGKELVGTSVGSLSPASSSLFSRSGMLQVFRTDQCMLVTFPSSSAFSCIESGLGVLKPSAQYVLFAPEPLPSQRAIDPSAVTTQYVYSSCTPVFNWMLVFHLGYPLPYVST